MGILKPLIWILAGVLCLPAAANGQEEPRLDPDSPAGVEYRLPLNQARIDAAGAGKRPPGPDEDVRRFGSGITRRGAKGGSSGSPSPRAERVPGRARRAVKRTPDPARVGLQAAAESTSDAPPVSLIAAAVLLAGGAIGLALRRSIGRSDRS